MLNNDKTNKFHSIRNKFSNLSQFTKNKKLLLLLNLATEIENPNLSQFTKNKIKNAKSKF